MLYHVDLLRAAREGVYVPLTVLVLALGAAALRARDAALPLRFAGGCGSAARSACSGSRARKGPWILPALGCAGRRARRGAPRPPMARAWRSPATRAVSRSPPPAAIACVQLVSWQNQRSYGTWTAVEFRQPAFARAYGALLRIDPAQRVPFVPVTRAALVHAAAAGPATAAIVAVLQSGVKDGFVRYGCDYHGLDPCDGSSAAAGSCSRCAMQRRSRASTARRRRPSASTRRSPTRSTRRAPRSDSPAVPRGAASRRHSRRATPRRSPPTRCAAPHGSCASRASISRPKRARAETPISRAMRRCCTHARSRAAIRPGSSPTAPTACAARCCTRSRRNITGSCRRSCSRPRSHSRGRSGTGRARWRLPGSRWR